MVERKATSFISGEVGESKEKDFSLGKGSDVQSKTDVGNVLLGSL